MRLSYSWFLNCLMRFLYFCPSIKLRISGHPANMEEMRIQPWKPLPSHRKDSPTGTFPMVDFQMSSSQNHLFELNKATEHWSPDISQQEGIKRLHILLHQTTECTHGWKDQETKEQVSYLCYGPLARRDHRKVLFPNAKGIFVLTLGT